MQFLNCVFNLQYSDNTDMSWIKNINQLQIFNTKIGSDSDIDPDMNFLKCNCRSSSYFLVTNLTA